MAQKVKILYFRISDTVTECQHVKSLVKSEIGLKTFLKRDDVVHHNLMVSV